MTKAELKEILAERPFQPLVLHMSNGRTHEVRHPENLVIADTNAAIVVNRDGEEVIRVISLPHVTETERAPWVKSDEES